MAGGTLIPLFLSEGSVVDGLLNVNKRSGVTSFDVVKKVRDLLSERKVGHTGTLDKPARGVLVVLLGRATKVAQFFADDGKEYLAKVRLGSSTDTDDSTGRTLEYGVRKEMSPTEIERVVSSFRGDIEQVPPIYSRVSQGGRRLHKLARMGEDVRPRARKVRIDELDILSIEKDEVVLKVVCSKGTYIRALARDIGLELGCLAHLAELVRLRVGDNRIENSIDIDDTPAIENHIVSLKDGLKRYSMLTIDSPQVSRIIAGQRAEAPACAKPADGEVVRVCDARGDLIAVGRMDGDLLVPLRVLAR
jgi:tRNA pseudouridine55 synthase